MITLDWFGFCHFPISYF